MLCIILTHWINVRKQNSDLPQKKKEEKRNDITFNFDFLTLYNSPLPLPLLLSVPTPFSS